jgi:transglutaminase/protease-like cytokinesis protein 3
MKTLIISFLIFILFSVDVRSQVPSAVKLKVSKYPQRFSQCEKLANLIAADFNNDLDKVAAVYNWMALNIEYDVKAYSSPKKPQRFSYRTEVEKRQKERAIFEKDALSTLKSKKAVCHGYSVLFKKLCELLDVPCEIVSGTSKISLNDIGKFPGSNDHAWNVVQINGEWRLIDVTWGAGSYNLTLKKFIQDYDDSYFLTNPDVFFLKHFPEDTKWLLTNKKESDFANLPLFYSAFIHLGMEMVLPHKGVLTKSDKGMIKFVIRAFKSNNTLYYGFNNDKYSKPVQGEFNNGEMRFEIPVNNRRSGWLTLYCNNKALVAYKLKL